MQDVTKPTIVQQFKPSTSTVASTVIGGAVTTIGLWVLGEYFQVKPPPEVSGAIGVLITVVAGYLFPGGRSNDVA